MAIFRNKFKDTLAKLLIFSLIFYWIFSGWPQIWQNPPFPPEVLTTRAASPEPFAYTGATQYFYPADGIYAVTVECWGGGGGGGQINNNGGGGGGGGAYAKSTNVAVAPGSSYAIGIGAGGASEQAGGDSTFNSTTVVADGGTAAANNLNGTGGTLANSTYNDAASHAGGDGGDGNTTGDVGAGGGGAGGPDGAGKTANNASNNVSTAGGDGNNSTGTGTGGAANDGAAGSPGNDDLTKGGGGGGGSEAAQVGGAGGTPGGGGGGGGDNAAGGAGGNGRCIVSYTDTWAPSVSQTSYDNTWTFATAPNNDADGQISMTATTGYDYYTISYSFTFTACASDGGTGGTSSGWQSADTTYTDIGLDPNKCYGYTVQTKDSLENTGTASSASETYSSANIPGQPTLGTATETTLTLTNVENSNPAASPITYFAVQVVTGDAGWVTKWVNGSGEPVASEVWLRDNELDGLLIGGGGTPLTAETTYGVQVKARNENQDETSLSTEGQGATTAPSNTAPTGDFYTPLPHQKTDGTKIVDVAIQVDDGEDDDSRALFEYTSVDSCDSGWVTTPNVTFSGSATSTYGTPPDVTAANAYQIGDTTPIKTNVGANEIYFDWDAGTDTSNNAEETYCLRITANDETVDDATPDTQTLTIDTKNPTAAGNLTEFQKSATGIVVQYGSQGSDTNFTRYEIYYKQGASGVNRDHTPLSDADLNFVNYNSTQYATSTGLTANTQYVFNIWTFDTYGNRATSTEVAITTRTGNFETTASSSQSFDSTLSFSFNSQTSTMSNAGAIQVADDRGCVTGADCEAGWTLNLTSTDWKSGQDVMQLDYDATGFDDNLGKMCVFPNSANLYREGGSLDASKGADACFSAGVQIIDLVAASSGGGLGNYWLTDMSLEQYIPGSPTVQEYTTTLIFTLQ